MGLRRCNHLDVSYPCLMSMFFSYLCGSKLIPGAEYAAHCYCGHQFGYFSGQLGDGATMYVGEVINNESQRWEVSY